MRSYSVNSSVFYLALLLFGFVFMSNACSTKKEIVSSDEEMKIDIPDSTKVVMNRGACFGNCAVYSLILEKPNKASYIGKRFTDRIGLHQKDIPDSIFNGIVKALEACEFMSMDSIYTSQVMDLATIEIIYQKGSDSHSVKGSYGRPDALVEVEKMLIKIAESEGWEKIGEDESESIIKEEIIIQTRKRLILPKWIRQYQEYGVMIKNRIDPNTNHWLVSFDLSKITPEELLEKLQNDPDLISAEFNRKRD